MTQDRGKESGRQATCAVEDALAVVGGKWKPLILYHLLDGSRRFNELRRLMPDVTQRMMTLHLRELEKDGLVTRTVHNQVPPRVDYALSEIGASLVPILTSLAEWGLQYRSGALGPVLSSGKSD